MEFSNADNVDGISKEKAFVAQCQEIWASLRRLFNSS